MDKQLNKLLADLVVEYHKLQSYHWYIKGKDFFTVHAKLEELYNGVNKAIDEVVSTSCNRNSSMLNRFNTYSSIN